MRIPIILSLCWCCFTGCITNRQLTKTYRKSSDYHGFAEKLNINGRFCNHDSTGYSQLIKDLQFCFSSKGSCLISPNSIATVSLHYDGSRLLTVTTTDSQQASREFALKVRHKKGYLSLKRHFYLIPIPALFLQGEQKTILFTDTRNRLVSVSGTYRFAWLFLLTGGDSERNVSFFSKLSP